MIVGVRAEVLEHLYRQEQSVLERARHWSKQPITQATLKGINDLHAHIERQIMQRGDGHVTDNELTALALLRSYRRQAAELLK